MKIGKTGKITVSRETYWWSLGLTINRSRKNLGWCVYLTVPGLCIEWWSNAK